MDTAALLLRLVVALASVLGLVWLFSRGLTRGRGRRLVPGMTEVVSRQALSRAASVVVVRVGERVLVLGVTEQQVSLLTETELPRDEVPEGSATGRRTEVLDLPEGTDSPDDTGQAAPLDVPARKPVPQQLVPQELVPQPRSGEEPVVRPRPRRQQARPQGGALAGSALSPATWGQALDVLRERTTRR